MDFLLTIRKMQYYRTILGVLVPAKILVIFSRGNRELTLNG